MKQGLSISGLAAELERRSATHRDYIADTRLLEAFPIMGGENKIQLLGIGDETRQPPIINHHALRQIGAQQDIPAAYMDRMMKDSPALVCKNLNHWFQAAPKRRMIRTNEHGVRAWLSDRYRILDNHDMAEITLPILGAIDDLEIISCQVTDTKLYIKAVTPRIKGEVVVGQAVQAGVIISNSEIGAGSLSVSPFAYFLWCLNGCATGKGLSKYHVGKAADDTDEVREIMADDTKMAEDKALLLRMRDALTASLDQIEFDKSLNKFREAQDIRIVDPVGAIEHIEKRGWLNQSEGKSVLNHLIEGGDLSNFGLSSAITRMSQDVESYDRASELEHLGGTIIELPKNEWLSLEIAA